MTRIPAKLCDEYHVLTENAASPDANLDLRHSCEVSVTDLSVYTYIVKNLASSASRLAAEA